MSNFNDSRGYQGNTNDGKGNDVSKLIKENASDAQVLSALRSKYPNDVDLVSKLFSEYEEKMSRIRRKAQKFATLILTKYSHLGPKKIIEKAKKYKKKYEFSDDEFNAFLNIALSDKSFSSSNVFLPNTELSRTLGHSIDIPSKMMVKSSEYDILQDILRMHQENTQLHAQIVIQALTHKDGDECKVMLAADKNTLYDARKDNMYNNIHPVLFALFAPKIKDIEDRMLLASISGIVSARYNGTQFRTQPDWLLYHDLIQDPNEAVCASSQKDSALVDLRNRVRVQTQLWKNVTDLRQGKFYPESATRFLVELKACKNNYYDSPDLAFIEDEGSVLRRLLSVFSYRPTVIAVKNQATVSPFTVGIPISNYAMDQVTTVPMINIRLPTTSTTEDVPLSTSLSSPDFYVENKVIVPKLKEVIYTRDVIMFYINRRGFNIQNSKLVNPAMLPQFNVLPFSISGYEQVLQNKVNLDEITVGNVKFNVKSVVCVDSQQIVGTSATKAGSADKDNVTFIKGCYAVVKCGDGTLSTTTFSSALTLKDAFVKYDPLNIKANIVTPLEVDPIFNFANDKVKSSVTIAVFVKTG